jgi:uncharacterized protein (TIGR02266 family)
VNEKQRDRLEQRRHPREPVTLVVDYAGAEDLLCDYTENLSAGGTYVHTTRDFEVGDEVRLVLSFPGLLKPISLAGVVRWTRRGVHDRGVGIEFVQFDEPAKQRLERIIAGIEGRDPDCVSRLMRVLVVEDNPHVARLIREGLRGGAPRLGATSVAFEFGEASNGREALQRLRSENYDAAIIDIYLPVLDGASVIAEIRADTTLRPIPIIAVSAGGGSARELAMGAGADFFLEKPMRLRQILDTMRILVERPGDGVHGARRT